MYESPIKDAHVRVLQRLSEHRIDAARRAAAVRGDAPEAREALQAVGVLDTVPWGVTGEDATPICEVVLDYGELEAEYAALRRGSAIFDRPDRAVVELRGADAKDLVDRLVTNSIPDGGFGTAAFLLERTGRIAADLRVVQTAPDRVLLELDRCDEARVRAQLDSFIFAEDVVVTALGETHHRVDVLGPDAPAVVEMLLGHSVVSGPQSIEIDLGLVEAMPLDLAGLSDVDEPSFALLLRREEAESVWERMLEQAAPGRRPARAIGWNAYNICRIESGTPLFHVDFGPDATPHETGLVHARVSFKKGCYPGQEVVARLESRAGGRGRRSVVGIRVDAEALPVAGSQVFDAEAGVSTQVGMVTSSTVSPIRGAMPIAFANVKSSHQDAGQRVLVNAEGSTVDATVTSLNFELETDGES